MLIPFDFYPKSFRLFIFFFLSFCLPIVGVYSSRAKTQFSPELAFIKPSPLETTTLDTTLKDVPTLSKSTINSVKPYQDDYSQFPPDSLVLTLLFISSLTVKGKHKQ